MKIGSSDRVDGAVPPAVGAPAEILASDSAWERPPPGPPMPLPGRRPHPEPATEPATADEQPDTASEESA